MSSGRETATLRDRVKELEKVKEHLRGLQSNSQWLNSLDEVELEVALTRGDGTTYVQRPKLRRVGGEWQPDLISLTSIKFTVVETGKSATGVAQP